MSTRKHLGDVPETLAMGADDIEAALVAMHAVVCAINRGRCVKDLRDDLNKAREALMAAADTAARKRRVVISGDLANALVDIADDYRNWAAFEMGLYRPGEEAYKRREAIYSKAEDARVKLMLACRAAEDLR
ncbi:hypothetical protein [Sutterella sp.]|uniref:hypothetical protein n=1 Tax=Sutterella sp. TaxID=1981025 RepID=UPI0026E103E6|nr:hypothetical protein [Sutterella sp.]MDO5531409.1 hypothetical protein [Sutterella sp.]